MSTALDLLGASTRASRHGSLNECTTLRIVGADTPAATEAAQSGNAAEAKDAAYSALRDEAAQFTQGVPFYTAERPTSETDNAWKISSTGRERVDGVAARSVVGAVGPQVADIKPYLLTVVPPLSDLPQLYSRYLKAFQNAVAPVCSAWIRHPITSRAMIPFVSGFTSAITDAWKAAGSDAKAQFTVIQMLAGVTGYFNATYVDSNGEIRWDDLGTDTMQGINESTVEATIAAGNAVADTAKNIADGAKNAVSTAWWTSVGLLGGVLLIGGVVLYKVVGTSAGQSAIARYTGGGK